MDLKASEQIPRSKILATFWISLALVSSSIEPLVVKLGYQASASAFQLLVLKLIFGGIFIAPIYRHFRWVGAMDFRRIAVTSGLYILTYALIFLALNRISAVVLITLITTTPALVALINQLRGRERTTQKFWFGLSVCSLGVLLTVDFFSSKGTLFDSMGILLGLASVATSAAYRTKMDDLTKKYSPFSMSAYLFSMNAVAGLLCIPWLGTVPGAAWPVAFWIGFAGAIANVAFLSALHLIGSTRLSVLSSLQRPLVILAAAVILHEPLSLTQGFGIVLVIVGVHLAKVGPLSRRSELSLPISGAATETGISA